jgi:hypothetical protein
MNKLFTFMRESQTARFLIPVGLILTIFGIVVLVINIKNQNYIKTDSTVVDVRQTQEAYLDSEGNQVEAEYSATVKYTVDGKEYTDTLDNIGKYNIGDIITIYYNPSDPSQITQTKSIILPIVLIIGGIASLTGGIISAVNAVKRHKKMKEQERSWTNE